MSRTTTINGEGEEDILKRAILEKTTLEGVILEKTIA